MSVQASGTAGGQSLERGTRSASLGQQSRNGFVSRAFENTNWREGISLSFPQAVPSHL